MAQRPPTEGGFNLDITEATHKASSATQNMSFKKDMKGEFGSAQPMSANCSSNSISSSVSTSSVGVNGAAHPNRKTGSRNRSTHGSSKRSQGGSGNAGDRNRGTGSGNSKNKKSQILLDDSHDLRSLLKSSKKPIDISHLATYNYDNDRYDDERDARNPSNTNRASNKGNNKQKRKTQQTQFHLSGMSYINANYKFILNYKGDYKPQLLDPNLPLDIKDIARVVVKQHDYHCPICLADEFVAPRMVKCGHIFCYPCLLNMFDEVKNDKSRTNLGNIHNPTISCPLCSEVIKEKFITLPVLVEQVREDEPKIKSKQYANLTLMHRNNSKIYAQPVANFYQYKGYKGNIPWISHDCTPVDYKQYSPYISSTRLMMCDFLFLKSCYQKEIDDLMTQKLIDSELYGDSGKYYDMAIRMLRPKVKEMDDEMNEGGSAVSGPAKVDPATLEDQMSNLALNEVRLPAYNDGYYYYEYDGNSRIRYYLSPLDVTVINKLFSLPTENSSDIGGGSTDSFLYNPAFNLPLNLSLYIENINSEEGKVTPELVVKFPFLGNLPYGAELGFLEVDWRKFDSSFIPYEESGLEANSRRSQQPQSKEQQKEENALSAYPPQLPYFMKKKLYKRSNDIKNKRANEERARVRGEIRREKETLEIFSRDEQHDEVVEEDFAYLNPSERWNKNHFVHIDLIDNTPVLRGANSSNVLQNIENERDNDNTSVDSSSEISGAGGSAGLNTHSKPPPMTVKTSVWGTKVPVVIDPEEEALRQEEVRQFDEMIRKAKADANEAAGQGRKGKKGRRAKMVPLPL